MTPGVLTECEICGTPLNEGNRGLWDSQCQECWEKTVDASWWEEVYPLWKMFCEAEEEVDGKYPGVSESGKARATEGDKD